MPGFPSCTASEAKSDCKYTDYMYLIIYPIVKRQLVATVKSCSDICVAAECQHQSVNSLQHRETRELRVTAEPLFFLIPFHLSYTTHRCHIVSGRTKGNIFPSCRNAHWVLGWASCLPPACKGRKAWGHDSEELRMSDLHGDINHIFHYVPYILLHWFSFYMMFLL